MTKFWRYFTMCTCGAIAELLTFIFLWFCTECMIFTILFWMMVVAFAVGGGVWYATDPARKPWSPDQVPIITLDKEAYQKGGRR